MDLPFYLDKYLYTLFLQICYHVNKRVDNLQPLNFYSLHITPNFKKNQIGMNRIILIGNGFDLAHGMKTSYNDFIDNYWEKTIANIQSSQRFSRFFENTEIRISNSSSLYISDRKTYENLESEIYAKKVNLIFKNKFLERITNHCNLHSWVDVENEYYRLLKEAYNHKSINRGYPIQDLNTDFEQIKTRLGEYLKEVQNDFKKNGRYNDIESLMVIGQKIYQPLRFRELSELAINKEVEDAYNTIKIDKKNIEDGIITSNDLDEKRRFLLSMFNPNHLPNILREILRSNDESRRFNTIPTQTLILNFNYTNTDSIYNNPGLKYKLRLEELNLEVINIHGTIENDGNDMIFGFGDELDEDYKTIERLNDNDYLENIKSINYLKTDNYKRLLEFINSDDYQVFLFGHSCGLSDRTMLNTIFEHDNCVSIKPFYHKWEEGDNHNDLIKNISRNFNDKKKMRDRVVNKTYCEPLM